MKKFFIVDKKFSGKISVVTVHLRVSDVRLQRGGAKATTIICQNNSSHRCIMSLLLRQINKV